MLLHSLDQTEYGPPVCPSYTRVIVSFYAILMGFPPSLSLSSKLKVNLQDRYRPPLLPTLGHINPVQTLATYPFKIHSILF